jgi:hypothetical protein
MYGLDELRQALSEPYHILRELNRLYHSRCWSRSCNVGGTNVFDEDWDTLIILDACRYDIFAERADLPGQLEHRYSRGAATPEFVRGNFENRQLHDVVYVTGNSWYLKLRDEIDAEVHAVYNPDHRTPEPVTEQALDALADHPNKRLVVHYIPPHHPFVGPTADQHLPSYENQLDGLFERIKSGEIDVPGDVLRQAYTENLERVLPEVERLINTLDGRTVVTADHGELLGDRSSPIPMADYGHHEGLHVEELVKVPWHVSERGSRRETVADEPRENTAGPVTDDVDEQLRQLGYKV